MNQIMWCKAVKHHLAIHFDEPCLRCEIERLRADANRYVWLRAWFIRGGSRAEVYEHGHIHQPTEAEIDSAIDPRLSDAGSGKPT